MEGDIFFWLDNLAYWHWWVLAGILIALEITAPGYVFLWIAIAAAVTGFVKLILPIGWEWQLLIFGTLSLLIVIYAKKFVKKYEPETDQPDLNRRGDQFVGRVFTLEEAIENGSGRVKIKDTSWRVEGDDLAAGSKVKVVSINGASLVVEKAE